MSYRINQILSQSARSPGGLVLLIVLVPLLVACFAPNAEKPLNTAKSANTSKSVTSDTTGLDDGFLDELEDEYETVADSIIEDFTEAQTALWKQRVFKGKSNYRAVVVDNRTALEATTKASASLLFRQQTVDLNSTPMLDWTWKISNIFTDGRAANSIERTRAGDDFPARVYVVFRDGPLPANIMAINYIWASSEPAGSYWPNPHQKNAIMLVVESGDQRSGEWVSHKRNVAEDFKNLFGRDISTLHGYAVMVDGDNTGNTTTSWFDRLSFSAKGNAVLQ